MRRSVAPSRQHFAPLTMTSWLGAPAHLSDDEACREGGAPGGRVKGGDEIRGFGRLPPCSMRRSVAPSRRHFAPLTMTSWLGAPAHLSDDEACREGGAPGGRVKGGDERRGFGRLPPCSMRRSVAPSRRHIAPLTMTSWLGAPTHLSDDEACREGGGTRRVGQGQRRIRRFGRLPPCSMRRSIAPTGRHFAPLTMTSWLGAPAHLSDDEACREGGAPGGRVKGGDEIRGFGRLPPCSMRRSVAPSGRQFRSAYNDKLVGRSGPP